MSGGMVSNVKWVEKPVVPPYTCAWCHVGHAIREKYLDTGLSYDFEGTVYLCDACSKTIRQGAGWYDQNEVDKLTESHREEILALQDKLKHQDILFSFLKKYGIDPVGIRKLAENKIEAEEDLYVGFGGTRSDGNNPKSDADNQGSSSGSNEASGLTTLALDSLFPGLQLS